MQCALVVVAILVANVTAEDEEDEVQRRSQYHALVKAQRLGEQARLGFVPTWRHRGWYQLALALKWASNVFARWSRVCLWNANNIES